MDLFDGVACWFERWLMVGSWNFCRFCAVHHRWLPIGGWTPQVHLPRDQGGSKIENLVFTKFGGLGCVFAS